MVMKNIQSAGSLAEKNFLVNIQQGILIEKYKLGYLKVKMKSQKLDAELVKLMDSFESEKTLSEIIFHRQMALKHFDFMQQQLGSADPELRQMAELWFKKLDSQFDDAKLKNVKYNSALIQQSAVNSSQEFKLVLLLNVASFDIIVQENEMLKDINNLHVQLGLFKQSLQNQPKLRDRVLNHIKKNFVDEMLNRRAPRHCIRCSLRPLQPRHCSRRYSLRPLRCVLTPPTALRTHSAPRRAPLQKA